ncbi:MAG: DUF1801 domain-containing protein [Anaerolineales bacterium]|jgi:hypothetical protein
MKSGTTHGTFNEAISGSSSRVVEIAKRLRELIIEVYPDVVEVPWAKQGIIGYGVGPKKMSEHFCYIAAFRDHVNLGFYYGAGLSDPEGLLDGTGKKMRHIKVRDIEMVKQPAIRRMIEAALDERMTALGIEK